MNIYNQIYNNNKDLLERLNGNKLVSQYLKEDDVFLVSLEKANDSDSVEIAEGLIVIHYNSDNYRIIGFTVPYVKEFVDTFKEFSKAENKAPEISTTRVATAGLTGLSFAF